VPSEPLSSNELFRLSCVMSQYRCFWILTTSSVWTFLQISTVRNSFQYCDNSSTFRREWKYVWIAELNILPPASDLIEYNLLGLSHCSLIGQIKTSTRTGSITQKHRTFFILVRRDANGTFMNPLITEGLTPNTKQGNALPLSELFILRTTTE
jgi:hypothetical protein